MVKFCEKCGSLYNHRITENHGYMYVCNMCGQTSEDIDQCIVINEFNQNAHDYPINSNMIYDMTLPRTLKLTCSNPDCLSREKTHEFNPEIIIFQYNPDMLNVGYMCTICRNYWKN
jgi:DNA-directed RNA polymerase subunit M/transcription elongation factor TFIIS